MYTDCTSSGIAEISSLDKKIINSHSVSCRKDETWSVKTRAYVTSKALLFGFSLRLERSRRNDAKIIIFFPEGWGCEAAWLLFWQSTSTAQVPHQYFDFSFSVCFEHQWRKVVEPTAGDLCPSVSDCLSPSHKWKCHFYSLDNNTNQIQDLSFWQGKLYRDFRFRNTSEC